MSLKPNVPFAPAASPFTDPDKVWFSQEEPAVPFLQTGAMPMHREGDPDHLKPREFNKGSVDVFDLGDADQKLKYNQVINAAAKGTVVLCREEVQFSQGRFVIYVRWMERYMAAPSQVYEGARRDPNSNQISFRD